MRAAAAAPAEVISIQGLRDWQDYNNAGWRYLKNKDYDKAEQRFLLAIKVLRPYEATERRLMARSYGDLARVLYHKGRYAEAEPLAKWALAVREKNPKVQPVEVFQSLYTLALIHRAQHHYGESELLLKRALALQEKAVGPSHVNLALTLDDLAGVDRDQGKYAEAEPLYKRALAIREKATPDENLDLADTSDHYAALLRRMKRTDEAEELEARALTIRDHVATKAARASAARSRSDLGFQGFK
jgi:tetratricopeptide (TPR) repeat protein